MLLTIRYAIPILSSQVNSGQVGGVTMSNKEGVTMSNKDCRPSTLRAVIEAIQSDESLTKGGKTDLTTGIRTFCRCVGRDPSEIDANPSALRAIARHAKPKLLGISDAHFKNSVSRLRKALAHVGISVDRRRNMPLTARWEALLNGIDEAT